MTADRAHDAGNPTASERRPVAPAEGRSLPRVVGLGGSVGAIPAVASFFRCTRPSGLVYVVLLHLAQAHESIFADLLRRCTSMPVLQVQESVVLQPDTVYIVSPRHALHLADGQLQVGVAAERPVRVAVDLFFRTLADACGTRATAIVLSGPDADGATGIRRIKERGGLAIAQLPDEAQHDGMPRAAIASGAIDWVLPVAEMPGRIAGFVDMARASGLQLARTDGLRTLDGDPAADATLRDALAFMRLRTGHDFSAWQAATVRRRIAHRLQINATHDVDDYLGLLRTRQGEPDALLRDLLASGSSFFRDADSFRALEGQLPALLQGRQADDPLRVWVAACATGEEAYSIAMLLAEALRALDVTVPVQIFATDVDAEAIRHARDGVYPQTIAADVSEERLRRFFIKDPRGYRVRRELREQVLFAAHDMLNDAPFPRIDLVACRYFLGCLGREARARVLAAAHFALLPGGRLFLGASDPSIDDSPLFAALDGTHRVYAPRPAPRRGLAAASAAVG
jgi:two-component system CheB/CheR fusion protein